MISRRALFSLMAAVALAGCAGQTVGTAGPATPSGSPGHATSQAGVSATPGGASATTGPKTHQVGETVTVTDNGADWARITVSDVSSAASYPGGLPDKPRTAGNVFIAARVTYEALSLGVDYNRYDWKALCGGIAVDYYSALHGPSPSLGSGHLPEGEKATGFIVFEVAAQGEVRLSYTALSLSRTPMFEVVVRAA